MNPNDPLGLLEEDNNDPLGLFEEDTDKFKVLNKAQLDAAGRGLEGAVEAGLGMMSGLPGQIAGGLWGLSTLASGQGLEKASENVKKAQESNFGFGAFKPYTEAGKEATEKIGSAMEAGVKGAGELGYKIGGELGRTNAEIMAEGLANVIEPGAVIGGVAGAMRRRTKVPEAEAPKPTSTAADAIAQTKAEEKAREDFMRAERETQGELFGAPDADPLGLFSEYDAGQAGVTEPISPKRASRQMDLPFGEGQPSQINVDRLGEAVRSDANPNDLAARDILTQRLQEQMDAELAAQKAQERPGLTSLEGPDGQMSLFDQGDLMGQRNQFFADGNPDFRIDENGMPVRVDKTMEGMNLENPLQRNLFGDELGPALDQGRSITQAIDATPANGQWAQRRGMINRLGGRGQELQAGPDLNAAMMEANGMQFPSIDTSMFEPKSPLPTERLGASPDGPSTPGIPPGPTEPPRGPGSPPSVAPVLPDTLTGGGKVEIRQTPEGFVAIKDGAVVGKLNVTGAEFGMNPEIAARIGEPASVDIVAVDPSVRGTGVGRSLYQAFNEAYGGNIRPSGKTTADAWKVWKRDFPEKVSQFTTDEANRILKGADPAMVLGNITDPQVAQAVMNKVEAIRNAPSETVASKSVEVLPPEQRPPVVDTLQTPRSPEKIAAKQEQRRAAEHMPDDKRLEEFQAVRTKEEAKQLALDGGMKDKAPSVVGRNLGSGANWAAIMTNNPLIKFANTVFRDARANAEKFSRTYITDKGGLAPTWSKMTQEERQGVAQALMEGDRQQYRLTPEIMEQLGFTEKQRQWAETYYKADDAMFNRWNEVLGQQGLKQVNRREGHVPGIFKGAYKAVVTQADGTTGVIATDSKWQMEKAKEWFTKNHPDVTITEQKRKGLSDYRNQSDIFSGMNDVLTMLAENDPRFAEVQALVSEAIKHGNNSIFAFNKHELSKKGVIGNEGNKPWLDAKQNTDAWYKAMVQYFEEGALHHELQGPLRDVKELSMDPDLNMPKTMKFLDSYVKHITGANANNPVAAVGNWAIDLGPKALGFGPRQTLQAAGTLKNNMSQLFMGWLNGAFTGAQLVQPFQTGLPFIQRAAQAMGNPARAPLAMFNGYTGFMLGAVEHMTGKKLDSLPDHIRQGFEYGRDRGLMNFSEMERAYEGGKTRIGRAKDKIAEVNMQVGELGTRMPVFLAIVDSLHAGGMGMKKALPLAENMAQAAMIDYHQWERPQIYGKLGTIGQFAGGLTTFKHGYVGQQGYHLKRAAKGDIVPLGLSVASMIALAGVAGMPFFDELDNIYGELTDKFGDKRLNIRDSLMENLPEWSKSGAIANASNIAIQSKFSSANMVPDSVTKLLSPQIDAFGKILADGYEIAKYQDDQAFANFLLDISPSTIKGGIEDKFFMNENDTDRGGLLLNRNRQGVVERTEEERGLRQWTGLRSNKEALKREADYRARMADTADKQARASISKDFGRAILNDKPETQDKLLQRFVKRGGDPKTLLEQFKQRAIEANTTEEARRDMGLRGTLPGLQSYEHYNKPGER